MSATQKALLLGAKQGTFSISTIPIPQPGPGQLLLKIHAVALNPVDWKVQVNGIIVTDYPAVLGTDISGTVEKLGVGVEDFEVGDKVCTQGYFHNEHAGFQQYTLANADITAKLPPNVSFEGAATLPVGLATAALGLYTENLPQNVDFGSAGLTPPWVAGGEQKYARKPIVVIGASSSVGQCVVQLARLSGYSPIIATASLHNTDHLLSLGATHVLSRNLNPAALQSSIKEITTEPLDLIYDAISLPETQNLAYELLEPGGCLIIVLFPKIRIDPSTGGQKEKRVEKAFGQVNFPPENRNAARGLYKNLTKYLETGLIQPNRVEVLPGGLEGIVSGLDRLQNDNVSGAKLVVRPQETA
ncbi:uncharacterized protein FIBRA_04894 [Fibroporia radiculosa]|uniref:Enoyl reductase (ER) domain-containing protein n=1 Tax=Fibroporia radiculosa TaxID=599839 RepID=J4GQ06_9APHY|nr:uncharacterized protein FIBRA_04894 [Fibroporia radiculosa]CCM02785.1 predicted protein [Fibroporia radiculosa]